jgi:hypothetical protein
MRISMELARMVRARKPLYLQMNDGQKTFFHRERDTFYFDLLSLLSLMHLAEAAILNKFLTLAGFDRIRTLSIPLGRTLHISGLVELVFGVPIQSVFSGVRWPNRITIRDNSIPGVHLILEVNREIARLLREMDMSRFRSSERWRALM